MAHYATGALSSLVPKLYKLLKDEYSRVKGVEKEIEFLVKELEYMQAFLKQVSDKPMEQLDEQTKLWARDVREMSYQIEDKIDIFLVRVEGKQEQARPDSIKRFIRQSLGSLAKIKTRHDIASEIKNIKGHVKELKERRDRYHIGNTDETPTPSVDPRLGALYKMVTELVGIDQSRGDLIAMLTDGDDTSKQKLKTVSVVGVGGLGKTTLAKAVYDHLKVDFECCAFVPVGQNPNVVAVLSRIHCELKKRKCEMEITDFIVNSLRDFLKDKRYLIVIDDIWDHKHWEIIKMAFVENDYGGRVITTTRNFGVASKVGEVVYKLKPLSDSNSKRLFCTRIFHSASKRQDYQLDEVPQRIMSKCGGVPLAIITMASLLANKPTEEWSAVYSSIGLGQSDNEDIENTKRILSFSFYDMPSHLRACLLYLGVYPEDTVIDKDDLICKWIAEGFVQDEKGVGLFVLGERYFFELINRSMIQPELDRGGEFDCYKDGCYLHDMVLGLIRSLCDEYNFLTILDNEHGTSLAQSNIVRRLSYQNKTVEEDLKTQMNMAGMRSFVAYHCDFNKIVPFSRFKVLRVLSLEGCSFIEHCYIKSLGDLLHLRYLSIFDTEIRELPEELGGLKFLQALNLGCTDIEELPSCIGRLTQLVCLRGDLTRKRASIDGTTIGKLMSLQNLQITAPCEESARKKFLTNVANLRELRKLCILITGEIYESTAVALLEFLRNLSKPSYLEILLDGNYFEWEAPGLMISPGLMLPKHLRFLRLPQIEFLSLPKCINSSQLPYLSHLILWVWSVDVCGIRTIGELPELCYLNLEIGSNVLAVDGGYSYFRKLRKCILRVGAVMFVPEWSGAPIMASVEDLELTIDADQMKSFCLGYGQGISFIRRMIGLHNFPSLKSVIITMAYSLYFSLTMLEEVQKGLRHALGDRCDFRIETRVSGLSEVTTSTMDIEVIHFHVPVAWFKRFGFDFDYSYLVNLPSLEKVVAGISCEFATPCEVEEAMAGLRRSVDAHPNLPMLEMVLHYQDQQPLNHYVATQDNEINDGPPTASVETAAEKEAEQQQYIYRYLPPRRAPVYATQQYIYKNDDIALRIGLNFAPPAKEFNDEVYLNLGGTIDLNLEQPIEDANDGIDLNFEAPKEDANDEIYLNLEQPIEDANVRIDLKLEGGIDLNLEGGIDLTFEPPVEDTRDRDDFSLEGWTDLNLDPPVQNVTEPNLAELFKDLVLGDPYAKEQDGAYLSYTSPLDVQAVGTGIGGHGSNTRADPNDE